MSDTLTVKFTESKDIDSSLIETAYYNEADRLLGLLFHTNGEVYTYSNVPPEIYTGLLRSLSPGHYYNSYIKGVYPSAGVHAGYEVGVEPDNTVAAAADPNGGFEFVVTVDKVAVLRETVSLRALNQEDLNNKLDALFDGDDTVSGFNIVSVEVEL
jgi:KTSC domain